MAEARSHLRERLGVARPIIQAPMGGGPTTPELVAAVSGAGGLGSIAGGYLGPGQLRREISEVRWRTDQPFAVNLFAGGATAGADDASMMMDLLARWHRRLGLGPPEVPAVPGDTFADKVQVLLEEGVTVASFTFGIPPVGILTELKARGVATLGTATTVREAEMLAAAGLDVVVAQGGEAGAHRGTFHGSFESGVVGGLALVPQVVDAVGIPVVASGGIMDGRGVAAAWALGAAGVQLGTAFLLAEEAGTSSVHRERLLQAAEDDTVITRAFSGRPARGIRNAFIDEVDGGGTPIPPYPLQNELTRAMRKAASGSGDAEGVSLWAGQGLRMARPMPAARLVTLLMEEAEAVVAGLCT